MGFVWVTNVGVGASIDAADRNETKDNVSWLYTQLGKNWPGNVRFPACGGAGFDMAAPCPVVWPIAVGDSIYQTPGAHPVSELQEDRDKLDWIDDNKCDADNAGHDNPENAAANPITRGVANPVTQSVANPITRAVANPVTQDAENPVTNISFEPGCPADCPLEDGAANDITQAAENPITRAAANPITETVANPITRAAANPVTQDAENPITHVSYQPGCGSDCPLEDGAANSITQSAENPITHVSYQPGCDSDCPLEDGAANPITQQAENPTTLATANPYTQVGEDTNAYSGDDQDLTTYKAIDCPGLQTGDDYQDYVTVQHTQRSAVEAPHNIGYDMFIDILVNASHEAPNYHIDNIHHCSSEHGAVRTHVDWDDRTT